jgi:FKBP-type peptidyl-prolyl cis-trans isomerase SlpA
MLVLTRRTGEEIVIGSAISVTVVAVNGGSVRLGITAPATVRVDRKEVNERRRAPVAGDAPPAGPFAPDGEDGAEIAQAGDRVQVHYVKRLQGGSVASSHSRTPLDLTVGIDHPCLPGLGLGLVGLVAGGSVTVSVPTERAYGQPDPARIQHWARTRFMTGQPLPIGEWVRILSRPGRHRMVRILEVRSKTVVVDTNHRWAGQAMELEVELLNVRHPSAGAALREP